MRITMLQTKQGSIDGITVETYEAGKTYDLGPDVRALDLANAFLREQWAKIVIAKPPEPAAKVEPAKQLAPEPEPVQPPAPEPEATEKPVSTHRRRR